MMTTMYEVENDLNLDQVLANNPSISPTAYAGMKAIDYMCRYVFGMKLYTNLDVTWENQHPWERMLPRLYRMFMADVHMNAPKDRTLFNYK